jgi:hypothetical protein
MGIKRLFMRRRRLGLVRKMGSQETGWEMYYNLSIRQAIY